MKKRLFCYDPKRGVRDLLATYTLEGDTVRVDLAEPAMQLVFRADIVAGGAALRPEDGKRYFDALDQAYSTSSLYSIEHA